MASVISDATIALAYDAMPPSLILFSVERPDLAFRRVFALTGVFILACGTTHLMSVSTTWHPDDRLDGAI